MWSGQNGNDDHGLAFSLWDELRCCMMRMIWKVDVGKVIPVWAEIWGEDGNNSELARESLGSTKEHDEVLNRRDKREFR